MVALLTAQEWRRQRSSPKAPPDASATLVCADLLINRLSPPEEDIGNGQ